MSLIKYQGITANGQIGYEAPPTSGGGFFQGTVIFVDPNHPQAANDSNLSTPFITLNQAMTQAPSGSKIYVAATAYSENLYIPEYKSLTIIGFGGIPVFSGFHTLKVNSTNGATTVILENIEFVGTGSSHVMYCEENGFDENYDLILNNCKFTSIHSSSRAFTCEMNYGDPITLTANNCEFTNTASNSNGLILTCFKMRFVNCKISYVLVSENNDTNKTPEFNLCDITDISLRNNTIVKVFNSTFSNANFVQGSTSYLFVDGCTINSATPFSNASANANYVYLGVNTYRNVLSIAPVTNLTFTKFNRSLNKETVFISGKGIEPQDTDGCIGVDKILVGDFEYPYCEYTNGSDTFGQVGFSLPTNYGPFGLNFKFVWSTSSASANTATFEVKFLSLTDAGAMNGAQSSSYTVTDTNTGANNINISNIVSVPFSPTGYRYLVLKIGRLGSTDTLAANVRLHGVIMEYTSNA